jgi:serine phosphatase RsbU (regulator of sigma subunit)
VEGRFADLRNFKLRFLHCNPGDLVIVVSDGVADNLDPQLCSVHPNEVEGRHTQAPDQTLCVFSLFSSAHLIY